MIFHIEELQMLKDGLVLLTEKLKNEPVLPTLHEVLPTLTRHISESLEDVLRLEFGEDRTANIAIDGTIRDILLTATDLLGRNLKGDKDKQQMSAILAVESKVWRYKISPYYREEIPCCKSCKHSTIIHEYDSSPDYYCTLGATPRPASGCNSMSEEFTGSREERLEQRRQWEQWAEGRNVDACGHCTEWQTDEQTPHQN